MDFWIDGLHIGYLSNKQELISALTVWQRKHEAQTLYLVDLNGCQYPYADYIQSILDNCSGEEKVMFLSATKDELYLQLVASIQEYIGVISQSLTKLSEMFYVRPDSEAWHELANFFGSTGIIAAIAVEIEWTIFGPSAFFHNAGKITACNGNSG